MEFIKSINIVDVIIVLMLLMAGIVGAKRGVFKQGVSTIGTILAFVLAFYLKDPVAEFLSLKLPFFDFVGIAKGLTSLNIIMYQMVAFILVLAVLFIILAILIKLASGIEKVLKWTIILGIPSRILGFVIGLIEGYVLVFIVLFFLSMPIINFNMLDESKLMPKVLNSSILLSNMAKDTNDAIKDIYDEIDGNKGNTAQLNLTIIELMLKYNIIDGDYLEKLNEAGKLNITGIDSLI